MSINPNTKNMIRIIAKALGELNDRAVFVGGATLPYYLPDIYESQVRPTEDIDIVMEVIGYNTQIVHEDLLRKKGFQNDISEGAPLCRWLYRDFKVDIMSSDSSALGFTNMWYKEGVEHAIEVEAKPVSIKIFSLPYFIAAKFEAFKGRGKQDFAASHDMEDIISVLEVSNQKMLENLIGSTSNELQSYLRDEFSTLLNNNAFIDALPGSVFSRANTGEAVQLIITRMQGLLK